MTRVEAVKISSIIDDSKENLEKTIETSNPITKKHEPKFEPIADTIEFNDFAKLDLRIAKIIKATHVKDSDKLLQLTVSSAISLVCSDKMCACLRRLFK